MKKYQHFVHNLLLYSVFSFYIVILLALLFTKRYSFRSLNLIPFHSIISYLSGQDIISHSFALSNVLGNVILFVPLGVYLTLFNRDKNFYKNFLWIILFSIFAEIMQYILSVGVSDVDDVILNGLGGAIGIAFYKILFLIFENHKKVRYCIEIIAPVIGLIGFFVLFLYNNA